MLPGAVTRSLCTGSILNYINCLSNNYKTKFMKFICFHMQSSSLCCYVCHLLIPDKYKNRENDEDVFGKK